MQEVLHAPDALPNIRAFPRRELLRQRADEGPLPASCEVGRVVRGVAEGGELRGFDQGGDVHVAVDVETVAEVEGGDTRSSRGGR